MTPSALPTLTASSETLSGFYFVLNYCEDPMAMTNDPAASPRLPEAPVPSPIREKLPPERVALLREWVEGTTHSFRRIGKELGLSPSTISRYATEGGWQRPAGAALPARIDRPNPDLARRRNPVEALTGEQRQRISQKLWRLAERQAEALEDQPFERALPPLARLTRTLDEMDKHTRTPLPAHEYGIDAPNPAAASTNCATNSRPIWSASSARKALPAIDRGRVKTRLPACGRRTLSRGCRDGAHGRACGVRLPEPSAGARRP